jgi:hypothetical protein
LPATVCPECGIDFSTGALLKAKPVPDKVEKEADGGLWPNHFKWSLSGVVVLALILSLVFIYKSFYSGSAGQNVPEAAAGVAAPEEAPLKSEPDLGGNLKPGPGLSRSEALNLDEVEIQPEESGAEARPSVFAKPAGPDGSANQAPAEDNSPAPTQSPAERDSFKEALLADSQAENIAPKDNWYGRMIGDWDFEWVERKGTPEERHLAGEWLFAWIIEGKAIQDIFILPARSALRGGRPAPSSAVYATTIRVYNQKRPGWDVIHIQPGYLAPFEAALAQNGDINELTRDETGALVFWKFTNITSNSFSMVFRKTRDGGKHWEIQGTLAARKRTEPPPRD